MHTDDGESHTLSGFPAAAVEFAQAILHNRARVGLDAGLSASELLALLRVASKVRVTPKELAAHLNITTPAVTYISGQLVNLGLLHRVDHPNDRRSLYLELTPDAHQMILGLHRDFVLVMQDAAGDLTADEIDSFLHTLQSVARSVMSHSNRAHTPEETHS